MKIIIFLLSIIQLASSNDFKKFDLNRLQYIDSLSNKLIKQKEFTGVSVLVKSSNQSFYNKNFGFGDIRKQTPIDENTMFINKANYFFAIQCSLAESYGNSCIDMNLQTKRKYLSAD